jgi:hypothetical protein
VKLTPNIDERGRQHRIRGGITLIAGGVVLAVGWAVPTGEALGWAASLAAVAGGAFMIFEGMKGWCVVRALGFKTRI